MLTLNAPGKTCGYMAFGKLNLYFSSGFSVVKKNLYQIFYFRVYFYSFVRSRPASLIMVYFLNLPCPEVVLWCFKGDKHSPLWQALHSLHNMKSMFKIQSRNYQKAYGTDSHHVCLIHNTNTILLTSKCCATYLNNSTP